MIQEYKSVHKMLYAFGSNGSGQLGLFDRSDKAAPEPCIFSLGYPNEDPVSIAAGGNHTLLLLPSGRVLSAGSNERSQRGQVDALKTVGFQSINFPGGEHHFEQFKACSATWEASMLVTSTNAVYTFGSGSKGELGHGQFITETPPRQLPNFPPMNSTIVNISSCMGHTVVVLSNGEVYGWGNGRKGQLGQPTGIVWSPRKLHHVPFEAVQAVCGKDFTYIVGPPGTGQHILLGPDKWSIRSSAPNHVRGWKEVGASWGNIFVLLDDDTLISWGRNDHGQKPAGTLPKLSKIAAGSEHCLALTHEGKVLAWGWGEHGNCGSSTESEGDLKNPWNEVVVRDGHGAYIRGIGAGCATSWITARP